MLHRELAESARRFSRRGAGEMHGRRQLELSGRPTGDRVTVSEDRRTLHIELSSPGFSSDLLRIIVEGDTYFR